MTGTSPRFRSIGQEGLLARRADREALGTCVDLEAPPGCRRRTRDGSWLNGRADGRA